MLEHYINKPHVIKRMQQSYFGYLFEHYIFHLHQRGYRPETIKLYCQGVEHFGQWLTKSNVYKRHISKKHINYFLTNHLSKCKCLTPKTGEVKSLRAAINQLLKIIYKNVNILSDINNASIKFDEILNSFDSYLFTVCGMADNTRICRRHYDQHF